MPRIKKVKKGDIVRIHYSCKLGNGTLIDSSLEHDEPLQFTVGKGQVIKGLEEAVIGMKTGETRSRKIEAGDAYGLRHEEWVLEVGRDRLPEGWKPEVGLRFEISRENGKTSSATVTKVTESTVTLDFNHPLAGKELIFDISLVEIS